jgi:hypothetical protein
VRAAIDQVLSKYVCEAAGVMDVAQLGWNLSEVECLRGRLATVSGRLNQL